MREKKQHAYRPVAVDAMGLMAEMRAERARAFAKAYGVSCSPPWLRITERETLLILRGNGECCAAADKGNTAFLPATLATKTAFLPAAGHVILKSRD